MDIGKEREQDAESFAGMNRLADNAIAYDGLRLVVLSVGRHKR
jgi:hypothetical protein